jgi:hypothetical protein
MQKLALYVLELCNFCDEKRPEEFYFVPECFISVVTTVFRTFIRMDLHNLDFLWTRPHPSLCEPKYPSDHLVYAFMAFVCAHLADNKIPNPDQQESFLTKLNLLVQYKELVARRRVWQR